MKKNIMVLCLVVAAAACKKNGDGGAPQILLTEIKSGGLTLYRFDYDAANRATRLESWDSDPANNAPYSYISFTYNPDGQISQLTAYKLPGGEPEVKAVLEYDSTGRLVHGSTYELQGLSPNTPKFTTTYKYNNEGRVSNYQQKDKNGKLIDYVNFLYYPDGHLKERQQWDDNGALLYMVGKTSYSVPGGYYPNGLEQLHILINVDFVASMYSDAINDLSFDQNGVITYHRSELMSNREFNEDGSLKKQVITYKFIKPEKEDKSVLREYLYITQ